MSQEAPMKVLWYTKDGMVDYDPAVHCRRVWNFLFWRSGEAVCDEPLLIAGDGGYKPLNASHESLFDSVSQYIKLPHPAAMVGAGNCMLEKLSWSSTGFAVTTLEELRPAIAQALGIK